MSWVRIEIEIQPERHDPDEVMKFLLEHFTDENGVPTAEVHVLGFGPEAPRLTSMERNADQVWANFYGRKIEAIKDFRGLYHVGLKEAKDYIDGAAKRNP